MRHDRLTSPATWLVFVGFFALASALSAIAATDKNTTPRKVIVNCASPAAVAALEHTIAKLMHALRDRDLAAYASTLNEDTTLLLPSGTLYRGKQAVIGFHRGFLADRSWTQDATLIRQVIHPHIALAFYKVISRSHDKHGKVTHESHFLMSLTFTREKGQWRLINDQVTKPPTG